MNPDARADVIRAVEVWHEATTRPDCYHDMPVLARIDWEEYAADSIAALHAAAVAALNE